MGDLLQAAESGQLDIDYGEQQLRVAAIRLREDVEYLCEAGSIERDGKCGKSGLNCHIFLAFHPLSKVSWFFRVNFYLFLL